RWTRTRTVQECQDEFNRLALPSGPIARIEGWPADENLGCRAMLQRLHDPVSGRVVAVPGSPLRMSVSPGRAPTRIPDVDEDRSAIEDHVCGREANRIAAPHEAA